MIECSICYRELRNEKELQVHKKWYHNITQNGQHMPTTINQPNGVCPDCGATLFHTEGCNKCMSCGFTKCL